MSSIYSSKTNSQIHSRIPSLRQTKTRAFRSAPRRRRKRPVGTFQIPTFLNQAILNKIKKLGIREKIWRPFMKQSLRKQFKNPKFFQILSQLKKPPKKETVQKFTRLVELKE